MQDHRAHVPPRRPAASLWLSYPLAGSSTHRRPRSILIVAAAIMSIGCLVTRLSRLSDLLHEGGHALRA